jgi:hypothetical protein
LWIKIDYNNLESTHGEGGCQVDCGGGFADPTLLVGDGEDSKGGGFRHRLFEAAGAYNLLGFT